MAPDSKESSFDLYYHRGWVYLRVYPTGEHGRTVYPEEVENRMRLLGMPRVRGSRIRDVISAELGTPEPLVEWPEGARLASEIEVEVAEDEMSATVAITPPKKGAAPPTEEEVEEALFSKGVVFGVNQDRIRRILAEGDYDRKETVATGREPIFGKSRQVEYLFELNRGKPYLEMPFGRINLKELNFIDNRKKGELLARLLPPVKAVDGSTVTGRVIPAERDDRVAEIPAGEKTHLNADGTELYASVDGNVRFREGRVIVEPVVEVENVNYETGNIHFDGSVVIEGSVADGFIVEATGNIQVGKGVGKATLKAGENILLQTGMNGNGEGSVSCGGNLFARYLESCNVQCRGNLFVEEAIMHATVSSWGHCILNGRRAECIAGELVVGGTFWCKKLGNLYGAHTLVSIGVAPDQLREYREARRKLEQTENEAEETEGKLERIEKAIDDGRREEKVLTARDQLKEQLSELNGELTTLRRKVPALRETLKASRQSLLVVEDTIFSGVIIAFGRFEYRPPEQGARKTILKAGPGEIQESGYDYHDPPRIDFESAPDAPLSSTPAR